MQNDDTKGGEKREDWAIQILTLKFALVTASDVITLGSRDVLIIILTGNSSVTHEKVDTYTGQGATAIDFTNIKFSV